MTSCGVWLLALVWVVLCRCGPTALFSCNNDANCDLANGETALNCPNDCPSCYFSGTKLTTYTCGPTQQNYSSCNYDVTSLVTSGVWGLMEGVQSPVTGSIFGYFEVDSTGFYTFSITGANVGARLFINKRVVVDMYFTLPSLDAPGNVYLVSGVVNTFEMVFISTSETATGRNLIWNWQKPSDSDFTPISELFYSQNTCYDGILDPAEKSGKLLCVADMIVSSNAGENAYCGDGICQEDDPNDCIQDCYSVITTVCSPLSAPAGHIPSGFYVGSDTLGYMISNEMVYHLPGIEHTTFGVQIATGMESLAPLFYYGYCDKIVKKIVQDNYRDMVFSIPDEVFAEPLPQCSFSTTSSTFSSSNSMKMSKAQNVGIQVAGGGGGGGITKVEVQAAFSYETSVSSARDLEQQRSGSIVQTEVLCTVSKVELSDQYTFHPIFIEDISQANTKDKMVEVIKKYGTHFYKSAVLGGKLEQISVADGSLEQSSSEDESATSAKLSFSASVSNPIYGSARASFDGSLDSSVSSSQQNEYEDQSSRTTVSTHGGAPGSFGPAYDGGPTTFGDWAQTVDLLPVPIDYQLGRIGDVIPAKWVVNASKDSVGIPVIELWNEAEVDYLNGLTGSFYDDTKAWYTMYWFYDTSKAQQAHASDIYLELYNAMNDSVVEIQIYDQYGPFGTEAPLVFAPCSPTSTCTGQDCDQCRQMLTPQSPLVFSFTAPRSFYDLDKANIYSLSSSDRIHSILGTSSFVLHDLSIGKQYTYQVEASGSAAFYSPTYDHDNIVVHLGVYKNNSVPTRVLNYKTTYEVVLQGRKGQIQAVFTCDDTGWPQAVYHQISNSNMALVPQFTSVVLKIPKEGKSIGALISLQIRQGLDSGADDIVVINKRATSKPSLNPRIPLWILKNIWVTQTFCSDLLDEAPCAQTSSGEGASYVYGGPQGFAYALNATAVSIPLVSIRNNDVDFAARFDVKFVQQNTTQNSTTP